MAADKRDVLVATAATLTALAEVEGGCSESMIYLAACKGDFELWGTVSGVLERAGWVTVRAHWVTLTAEGRNMAAQIEAALKSRGGL